MTVHSIISIDRTDLTMDPLVLTTEGGPWQLEAVDPPVMRYERVRATHPDRDGGPLTHLRAEVAAVAFTARLWGTDLDDAMAMYAELAEAVSQWTYSVTVTHQTTGAGYTGEQADYAPVVEDGEAQGGSMLVRVSIPVQPDAP